MAQEPLPENLERTAAQWGAEAGTWAVGRGRNWFEVPAVQDRINQLISGHADTDAYHWLLDIFAQRGRHPPFDYVLTLGCGAGDLERGLAGIGFAHHYEGIDVADQAIERARSAALAIPGADIAYKVADINAIKLVEARYDVIFCQMSAHHFSNLEGIFAEVHRALKPGGIFFLNEYVGPKHFQWPPHQVALIDLLLKNLPSRWVRMADGGLRRSFTGSTVEQVVAVDPTEAIRSDEILPVLAQRFVVTTCAGYGGNLLHGLLDHIGANFIDDDPDAKAMLGTLFALEDWALTHRFFGHDFAVIVAERPEDVGSAPGFRDPAWRLNRPIGNQLEERSAELEVISAKLAASEAMSKKLREQDEQRTGELKVLRGALAAMEASRSWRLTAPLRNVLRLLRRLAGRSSSPS